MYEYAPSPGSTPSFSISPGGVLTNVGPPTYWFALSIGLSPDGEYAMVGTGAVQLFSRSCNWCRVQTLPYLHWYYGKYHVCVCPLR